MEISLSYKSEGLISYNQKMIPANKRWPCMSTNLSKGYVFYPISSCSVWEHSIYSDAKMLIHVRPPSNLRPHSIKEIHALGLLLILAKLSSVLYVLFYIINFISVHYSPDCCHCSFHCFHLLNHSGVLQ